MQKSMAYLTLSVLLSACGGGDSGEVTNQGSSIASTSTLFAEEWFSFSYDMTKTESVIYKEKISKNTNQVLEYTATVVIGDFPLSELVNQTGVDNLVYNPYANLYDVFILTKKRLLNSPEKFLLNTARPKKIVFSTGLNTFSTVPYNLELYKDTAVTTIEYVTRDLSGTLVTEAINQSLIAAYDVKLSDLKTKKIAVESELAKLQAYSLTLQTGNVIDFLLDIKVQEAINANQSKLKELDNDIATYTTNLTKLKNTELTFVQGAIGVQQMVSTTYEDSVTFTLANLMPVNSISDWKASYGANVVFQDYLWSGQNFSCVVDINNAPTGDCAVNYNGLTYRANYLTKGVSTQKPYYILFNKKAADVLEAAFKEYLIGPTE